MLDANLRRPTPQISRIRESRDGEGSERGGSQGREKQKVLPSYDGRVAPVHPYRAGAQPHQPQNGSIGRIWKSTGKVEFDVSACARSCDVWPEDLQSDLRLTQRPREGSGGIKGVR